MGLSRAASLAIPRQVRKHSKCAVRFTRGEACTGVSRKANHAPLFSDFSHAHLNGRPPSGVEDAAELFFRFCIQPEIPPASLQEQERASPRDGLPAILGEAEQPYVGVDLPLSGMQTLVEEDEGDEIKGFDSGGKQAVQDAAVVDVQEGPPGAAAGDEFAEDREIGLEGLLAAAKYLEGVEWDEAAADRFLEKHVDDEDVNTTMTLEEFVDAYDSLCMTMRIFHLNILVDDALEQHGAREMDLAQDRMMQQLFDDALAAIDRADKCMSIRSIKNKPTGDDGATTAMPTRGAASTVPVRSVEAATAMPTRGTRLSTATSNGHLTSRLHVEEVRANILEMQRKVSHRVQFEEAMRKGKSALLDVEAMSKSMFKRSRAAKRLVTAKEALAAASDHLKSSCPPPQLGVTRITMLLERWGQASRNATGSTAIGVFEARAKTGGGPRSGTADLLTLPEDDVECHGDTAETDPGGILSDRTHAEVTNLVAEGQMLMEQLPEGMSGVIADAVARGGSPVAELMRRGGLASPMSDHAGMGMNAMLSDRTHAEVTNLVAEGQMLMEQLPEGMSGVIADAVARGGSPVAELMRRGPGCPVDVVDDSTGGDEPKSHNEMADHTARPKPASDSLPRDGDMAEIMEISTHRVSHTPDYSGPVHLAHLPGEYPLVTAADAELDMQVVRDLLTLCGIKQASDWDLDDLLDEVQAEYAIQMQQMSSGGGTGFRGQHGLSKLGPEAALTPMIYERLQPVCWRHDAAADLESALQLKCQLQEQSNFYEKARDAFEDAGEEFAEGAYTESKGKALEADRRVCECVVAQCLVSRRIMA